MGVPLIDVQARWAYSEISDGVLFHYYDSIIPLIPGINELRAKRTDAVPFDQLSVDERYVLALAAGMVRPNLLIYLIGADPLDLVEITREALAMVMVAPNVWEQQRFATFGEYIETGSANPDDARNVKLREQTYEAPLDPVTVGRFYGAPVLIDGYHRAARLWKFCPGGKLYAYMPRLFALKEPALFPVVEASAHQAAEVIGAVRP